MEDTTIRLVAPGDIREGDYSRLDETGLAQAILALDEAATRAAGLAAGARFELLHRKRESVARAHALKGDPFGVVKVAAGAYTLDVNTPRRVEWDQERLKAAWLHLEREWNSDPAEYIDRKLSVKESKYKAWPTEIRALFEPARTVSAGTPTLKITPTEKE